MSSMVEIFEAQKAAEEKRRRAEAEILKKISIMVNETLDNTETVFAKLILTFIALRFNQIETQIKALDKKLDAMQERLENNNEKLDRIMFWLEDADKHKIYANKCIIKQKL